MFKFNLVVELQGQVKHKYKSNHSKEEFENKLLQNFCIDCSLNGKAQTLRAANENAW